MRILHLEKIRYPEEELRRLEKFATVDYLKDQSQAGLCNWLSDKKYQVIFTRLGLMLDENILKGQAGLLAVVTPTTGLNHIDVSYCKRNGVAVISLQGESDFLASVKSTAEHCWSLILMLARNMRGATEDVLAGNWRRGPFLAYELEGKTLGVIGYGRLGKIVTSYAKCFGMKVVAYDCDEKVFDSNVSKATLSHLLQTSDILTLHIPSNPETKHFMDRQKFSKMKVGSIFINTSRGEVVEESALLDSLGNGKIKCAAVDVLDGDSAWNIKTPMNHPLIAYAQNNKNLLITPHMGGYGRESIQKTRSFITDKFLNKFQ